MLDAIFAALGQWLRYRRTLHELNALDRRLRADLGLSETDFSHIADQAAGRDQPVDLFALLETEEEYEESRPVRRPARTPCADRAGSRQDYPA